MNSTLWIAIFTAIAAVVGQVLTGLKLLTERAKNNAEIVKLVAEANSASKHADTDAVRVVRDISEASAIMIVPLKNENRDLWVRVDSLEKEVQQLTLELRGKDRELHEEREFAARERRAFEDRMKALMQQHQVEMENLRKESGR